MVTTREERRSGSPVLMCSSVFGMGTMITVEYAEEARFFPQRVIVWISSIAAMFCTSQELDDPPSGRFWTLSPDGDVHPETLLAPELTGFVWLDGRRQLILTTMMLAGHRLVRFYGFLAQMRIFTPEVTLSAVLDWRSWVLPKVLAMEMKANRERQSSPEKRSARRHDRTWRGEGGRPPRGSSPTGRKTCCT